VVSRAGRYETFSGSAISPSGMPKEVEGDRLPIHGR
jgi:hypothetical protein